MSKGPSPKLLLSIAITPRTAADADRLARALAQLTVENPHKLRVLSAAKSSQVEVGFMSEQHLLETVDSLRQEFGVEAILSVPRVIYREALTRPAEGEAKHAKQCGGRGEYGHVQVRIHPRQPGEVSIIENHVVGGEIPEQFIPAVQRGITDALERGPLGGYPVEDVYVEIADGSYHDIDSNAAAFRLAASLATQRALQKAEPILMEPVMRVEVVAPADYEEEIVASLVTRRGLPQPCETRGGGTRVIRALVPLASLFGYAHELHSKTYGHGSYAAEFQAFSPCEITGDDDRDLPVREPHRPAPKPRDSAIALPEPNGD